MTKTAPIEEPVEITTEYVALSKIRPNPKNPRRNELSVVATANSIRTLSYVNEITTDEDYIILAGHTRYKALNLLNDQDELGKGKLKDITADHIRIKVIRGLTSDEKVALMLADNKTGENSTWDEDLLRELRDGIKLDTTIYGFEEVDLLSDAQTVIEPEDDEYKEVRDMPDRVKTGDIWKLGDHYLICGDSTDERTIKALMKASGKDEPADMLLTDPPYNVNYEDKQKSLLKERPCKRVADGIGVEIDNDNMDDGSFKEFLKEFLKVSAKHLKEGGAFYIWHADINGHIFRNALAETPELSLKQVLIWVKNHFTLGHQDYQWKHEPCLYGWKEGAPHYFINDRSLTNVIEDTADLSALSKDELIIIIEQLSKIPTTVIYADKPQANKFHPTMKPIPLLAQQILNSTRERERAYWIHSAGAGPL